MTIRKLKYCPYGQAHVEIDKDGNVYMFSYRTLVCVLDKDGWLECTGTYSQTTRKHIGCFMKEYVTYPNGEHGDYHTAKCCYTGNYRLNIHTGEVEDL